MEASEKVLSVLKLLADYCITPKVISTKTLFSLNNLAGDYGKIVTEAGFITKIQSGKRGPTKYLWSGIEPTIELAESMVDTFNKSRTSYNIGVRRSRKSDINDLREVIRKLTETVNELVKSIRLSKVA